MRVTATFPITHRCPYVDEVDVGLVTFTWDEEAPDVYVVAAEVSAQRERAATHEAITQHLADVFAASVRSTWRTAGADVTVEATPSG